jgi:hypothetical protein
MAKRQETTLSAQANGKTRDWGKAADALAGAFTKGEDAAILARMRTAATKLDYLELLCELHGVTLQDVYRVRVR